MGNTEMVHFLKKLTKKLEAGTIQVNLVISETLNGRLRGKSTGSGLSVRKAPGRRGRKKLGLPVDREVFRFLLKKDSGESLATICRRFNAPKEHMLKKLQKLCKRNDLAELKGKFFLIRRVRKMEEKETPVKPAVAPIEVAKILGALKKLKSGTLPQLAGKLNEPFQRLIKPMRSLVLAGKVQCGADKVYTII